MPDYTVEVSVNYTKRNPDVSAETPQEAARSIQRGLSVNEKVTSVARPDGEEVEVIGWCEACYLALLDGDEGIYHGEEASLCARCLKDAMESDAEKKATKAKRGVYDKFKVVRSDGKSEPGEKHAGCRYFVLDLDHDPHAREAIEAYAESCKETLPALASDLRYAAQQLEDDPKECDPFNGRALGFKEPHVWADVWPANRGQGGRS